MSGTHFLDDTTQTQIGWSDVWRQFQPLSRAGERYKRGVRPFLPEQRAQWQLATGDWLALHGCLEDAAWRKTLCAALRELPDCEALLQMLAEGATLRQVDFFELKTFLWQGMCVTELLVEKGVTPAWWIEVSWERLLRQLNPPGALVPAFSLVDAGDPVLSELQAELAQLEGAIFQAKKQQTDRLRERYARGPGKAGQYMWEKSERKRLDEAAADPELRLLQENQFEAVYQVVEPAEVALLQAQHEQKRAEISGRELLVLQQLVQAFRPAAALLLDALQALARLDFALAKADVARQWGGCVAEWQTEAIAAWQVVRGWHPVARAAVEQRGGVFTCLDLELQPGVGLITGPNMGGKTVALQTFALLQALAQYALPVPAERFAFHPVERVGFSGGEEQSIVSGLSSFGGEMRRIATLLQGPGRALLLLDEVARTTNPEEGEALAIGLATYLLQTEHAALIASHFPGVAQVQGMQKFRVAGLRSEVLAEWERSGGTSDVLQWLQNAIDYRIVKSAGDDVPKQAVRIATCFGLPEAVLQTTRAVLQAREKRKEGPEIE